MRLTVRKMGSFKRKVFELVIFLIPPPPPESLNLRLRWYYWLLIIGKKFLSTECSVHNSLLYLS